MSNNLKEAIWLIRDKLQSVIDGNYTLYNTVSKEYLEITKDNIEGMIDMFIEQLAGHGIKHLQFIRQEYSKISFNTSITELFEEVSK